MSAPAIIHHAHFSPALTTVASAPIVEILRMYCLADIDTAKAEKTWAEFADIVEDSAEGYLGQACGWIVEELEYEKIDGKAKGLTAVVAWASLEAHMKYRETQAFKDSIGMIRGLGKGVEVVSIIRRESLNGLLIRDSTMLNLLSQRSHDRADPTPNSCLYWVIYTDLDPSFTESTE
jgi:hypothetical protein